MEGNNLNESQVRVLTVLASGDTPLSYEALAEKSGCSYDGVRGRVSELVKAGFNIQRLREGSKTLLRFDTPETELIRSDLKKPQTYGDVIGKRMKSLEDYYGITDFLNSMRKVKSTAKKRKPVYHDQAGVLVLSDLHFGSIVKEGKTITYNTDDAFQRMKILTDNTIERLADYCIDELYIAIIGDVVEGDMIYKNQMFYVEKPAIEQVQDAVLAITQMIKEFEEAGIMVSVGCVRGNHGITNYKNLEMDNWDNVVYDMLSLVFADNEAIPIDHFQEDQAKVCVLDKQLILYHGDALGDQCKTAAGLKTFRGMCGKHKLNDGDIILIGHLHTFGMETDQRKTLIRNGALTDASEYALKLNLYDEPSQTLLILEKDKVLPDIVPISVRNR